MSALAELIGSRWPEVIAFMLVLGRTGALIISAPFWSGTAVPPLVRVLVAVALSAAVYPLADAPRVTPTAPLWLAVALTREVLVGLVVGWAAQLLFAGMRLAGHEIEIKMGLGLAQLVDPGEGGQTTIMAGLFSFIAALVFFSLNGHHLLIRALAESYALFPIGAKKPDLARGLVASAATIFSMALRVSAPAVVGMLLSDLVLGIVSRVVPQMNVFIVALPLQMLFGILLVLLSLPAVIWFFADQLPAVRYPLSGGASVALGAGG